MLAENWDVVKRGTLIFTLIAAGLCIIVPVVLLNNVQQGQRKDFFSFVFLLVPMGAFCLWLFWVCMYMSQINPMIYPVRHIFDAEIVPNALKV